MRSADRKLLPQEVARKRKKLDKTLGQLEGLKEGTRKHHRKMFKAEKTLDQVRTGKSGIRPTKSPLKQENDSIAAAKAWKDFRKSYMVRKFKGNDERLGPITASENEAEYDREKNEFYYDTDKKKMRLIPTDDAERKDKSGIQSWQLAPDMKAPLKKSPLQMVGVQSPLNKISGPCKAAAKKKFKVWPSAYASGWGVRCTKAGGPSKYGGGKKK